MLRDFLMRVNNVVVKWIVLLLVIGIFILINFLYVNLIGYFFLKFIGGSMFFNILYMFW